jgi:ubiquinone/menaquinone biosynthesis C-methylase UbiE
MQQVFLVYINIAPLIPPGDEIVMLAEKLPEALFVGLDLSEGMLEVAREVATVAGIRYVEIK